MDARAKQAMLKPRRETKMVDRQPTGPVHQITGLRQRNAFESGFTVCCLAFNGDFMQLMCT